MENVGPPVALPQPTLTFVLGKKLQLFAAADEVAVLRDPAARAPAISVIEEILQHPKIAGVMKEAGVIWKDLGNMNSIADGNGCSEEDKRRHHGWAELDRSAGQEARASVSGRHQQVWRRRVP
jgi:hypothetical protein